MYTILGVKISISPLMPLQMNEAEFIASVMALPEFTPAKDAKKKEIRRRAIAIYREIKKGAE